MYVSMDDTVRVQVSDTKKNVAKDSLCQPERKSTALIPAWSLSAIFSRQFKHG